MVDIGGIHLVMFIARGMLQFVVIGILITELFNHDRENKFDVFWFLSMILFWIIFLIISDYKVFTGNLPIFLGVIALLSLIIMFTQVVIILVKKFKFFNKILALSVVILIFTMLIVVLLDRWNFLPGILLPMVIASLVVTVVGTFTIFDFLIKTSKGYKMKIRRKKKGLPWRFALIGVVLGLVLTGGLFVGIFYSERYVVPELSGELNVYNWEGYFASDTIENFEKEFGVKVNLEYFSSNQEMFDTLKSDPGKYDVAMVSERLINEVIAEGVLVPVDVKNVPNLENLDSNFLNAKYNSEEIFGVPYMWGTTGLAINTKYISEDADSWGVLWDDGNGGRISLLNDEDLVLGLASLYIGNSIIPQTVSEFEDAANYLRLQKSLLRGYEGSTKIKEGLISEELWAAQAYSGDVYTAAKENPNLKYMIPKEGAQKWVDNLIIPAGSKNKLAAEAFINYLMRPGVNADIANELHYLTANEAAKELLNENVKESYLSMEESSRLVYFSEYTESKEIGELKDELWEELTA